MSDRGCGDPQAVKRLQITPLDLQTTPGYSVLGGVKMREIRASSATACSRDDDV